MEKDNAVEMNRQKLKVGLLLDSYSVPAWFYEMIGWIVKSDYAEISLVVMNNAEAPPKPSLIKRVWNRRGELSYFLYRKLEDKIYKPSPNAFELKDLTELVQPEEINVVPKCTKFSDRVSDEDVEQKKKQEVDVLLRMGFRILRGGILSAARYGIWSFHHGDNAVNRGGLILDKSYSCTDSLSLNRNLNNYYWKAATFIPRKLKELHQTGADIFFQEKGDVPPYFYYNRLYLKPKNGELLTRLTRLYGRKFRQKLANIFYFNQWILLFKFNKKEKISRSFFRFKRIIPPKDRFWADPFVIYKNERYYIFLEELLYKTNKGHISVIEMDEKGKYGEPQRVLERDYHLSYPFLIEDGGELYMIPETLENQSIELYRCTDFPLKWELEKVLIPGIDAVDATVLKKDGTYWLFANVKAHKGASTNDELCLFYADTLTSEWTPHPLNPIVSDVKTARPAGKIFEYEDKLYRPAQNCSKHYGYGMQICEIKTLTKEQYEEVNVQSIYPNWAKDLRSTHTLNADGKLTVIDALIRRRK